MIKSIVIFDTSLINTIENIVDPCTTQGLGELNLWAVEKKECNFTLVLYFLGSAFSNSTNCRSYNTNVFSIEKIQCIVDLYSSNLCCSRISCITFDSKFNLFVVFVFVLTHHLILEYLGDLNSYTKTPVPIIENVMFLCMG